MEDIKRAIKAMKGIETSEDAIKKFATPEVVAEEKLEIESREGDLLENAMKLRNNTRLTLNENLKRFEDGLPVYETLLEETAADDVEGQAKVERAATLLVRQANKVAAYAIRVAAASEIIEALKPEPVVVEEVVAEEA